MRTIKVKDTCKMLKYLLKFKTAMKIKKEINKQIEYLEGKMND